uniref:Uncharacterized protein n=1 Tax=Anguilla anguilla TaxID=7936 RepID=A0A0E9XS24_ANGAN
MKSPPNYRSPQTENGKSRENSCPLNAVVGLLVQNRFLTMPEQHEARSFMHNMASCAVCHS